MRKYPFIWLGSGRAKKRNVPRKGWLLDQAANSGLPVPQGGILLDEFFHICLKEGVVKIGDARMKVPDPVWLHEVLFRDVRFPLWEMNSHHGLPFPLTVYLALTLAISPSVCPWVVYGRMVRDTNFSTPLALPVG